MHRPLEVVLRDLSPREVGVDLVREGEDAFGHPAEDGDDEGAGHIEPLSEAYERGLRDGAASLEEAQRLAIASLEARFEERLEAERAALCEASAERMSLEIREATQEARDDFERVIGSLIAEIARDRLVDSIVSDLVAEAVSLMASSTAASRMTRVEGPPHLLKAFREQVSRQGDFCLDQFEWIETDHVEIRIRHDASLFETSIGRWVEKLDLLCAT